VAKYKQLSYSGGVLRSCVVNGLFMCGGQSPIMCILQPFITRGSTRGSLQPWQATTSPRHHMYSGLNALNGYLYIQFGTGAVLSGQDQPDGPSAHGSNQSSAPNGYGGDMTSRSSAFLCFWRLDPYFHVSKRRLFTPNHRMGPSVHGKRPPPCPWRRVNMKPCTSTKIGSIAVGGISTKLCDPELHVISAQLMPMGRSERGARRLRYRNTMDPSQLYAREFHLPSGRHGKL